MEKMNALTLIIALVVGVILTGALLAPVIGDAVKTEETIQNDGYFRMAKILADDENEYVYEYSKASGTVTVNDEVYALPQTNLSMTILATNNGIVRANSIGTTGENIQVMMSGANNFGGSSDTLTITLNGGTLTAVAITSGETSTATTTYEYAYVLDKDGAFSMKKADTPAYMHEGNELYVASDIFAEGVSSANGYWGNVIRIEGDLSEVDITYVLGGQSLTFGDVQINKSPVDKYIGLYALNNIQFNATGSNGTTAITYSYFIVPYEVTAELTNHLTPGQISLMGAIPVMVIVALLMAAVGAIALRRAD